MGKIKKYKNKTSLDCVNFLSSRRPYVIDEPENFIRHEPFQVIGGIVFLIVNFKNKGEIKDKKDFEKRVTILNARTYKKLFGKTVITVNFTGPKSNQYVVVGKGEFRHKRLSRLITNCPKNKVVDHLDGNVLNNLDENLRNCCRNENMLNKISYNGKPPNIRQVSNGYRLVIKYNDSYIQEVYKDEKTALRVNDVLKTILTECSCRVWFHKIIPELFESYIDEAIRILQKYDLLYKLSDFLDLYKVELPFQVIKEIEKYDLDIKNFHHKFLLKQEKIRGFKIPPDFQVINKCNCNINIEKQLRLF